MSHLKKYRERPSPPYPANSCATGSVFVGNDRQPWRCTRNVLGVNRWVAV